ncbi:class I SAM-dependent methyltransferase [Winogradskyella helgolandensis]|uniref:class I SAM-dependent methyltransferase n=1 Tax=Winogradskyella helgolandensis TaxID=2697010 RepID=UPI0015BF8796|nr:class I SAM-dependent methyltransferase [Winogradskyella helgolandensis]
MKNNFKKRIYQYLVLRGAPFLTATVGNLLVYLRPEKAQQLRENGLTLVLNNNLTHVERLMRNAILNKIEKKSDYNTLESLHKSYWVNQGDDFCSDTEARFESEFLPNWAFVFDILKEELKNETNIFKSLVEIGTGNGSVLNYLSTEFPKIEKFVGIDLSPDQTKINNEKYNGNSRLEFVAADGLDWIRENGSSHTIFVTSGGVLEYFTQPRLQEFFKEVNSLGKIIFIAIEPKGVTHNFEKNPNSELYGHERSFSHNYPKLFKEAGFNVWHNSQKPWPEISQNITFIGATN